MDVMKPSSPNLGFDFNSVPSSPRRFGECFFSAPTSPSRMSEFYREFDRLSTMDDSQITESSTGNSSSTTKIDGDDEEDDFAFDFRQPSEKTHQLSAEELFAGGKIKPLQVVDENDQKTPFLPSPRSSKSPLAQGKKMVQAFETAIERARVNTENGRGRQRVQDSPSKNSSRRTTRSLSPYRVSELPWEEEEQREKLQQNDEISKLLFSSSSSKGSSSSRKWKLKDLLLFRSASEGHNKDPLKKYSSGFFRKPEGNYNKNSSFKSKDSSTAEGSKRKVSAHELHYTTNKAVSENMKKKTFLPYKQGILGKLAFNSNGFGTLGRSYNFAK
ncbi:hypothetical protein like AT2G26530 [Hibiscus trionum]|uniref:Uncharacterized protein n=1 Tax=Hibiscus trionum TaxID=183268 RepID=A0A9W7MK41_HIBTR|nr:hypothetical protein like AT2G26530 [Hibiscus trionum]